MELDSIDFKSLNTMNHPVWIDTDNSLGSGWGDVDDGFALFLANQLEVHLITTSFGNTSALNALNNTIGIKDHLKGKYSVKVGAKKSGSPNLKLIEKKQDLSSITYLALGPLTQISAQINAEKQTFKKVVVIGSRLDSQGVFYPYWPHEFNLAKDPSATVSLFTSQENIDLIGLEQAQRLQLNFFDWNRLSHPTFPIKKWSRRWILRNLLFKLNPKIILWDVVAVASLMWPDLFNWEQVQVSCSASGQLSITDSGKVLRRLKDFDVKEVKNRSLCFFT